MSLLNEVEINEEQAFFSDWSDWQTWSYAASFLYDFCLHVSINYFNLLFHDLKYPKDYKLNCLNIINKYFVVDNKNLSHYFNSFKK